MNLKAFFNSPICEFEGSVLGPEPAEFQKAVGEPAFPDSWALVCKTLLVFIIDF